MQDCLWRKWQLAQTVVLTLALASCTRDGDVRQTLIPVHAAQAARLGIFVADAGCEPSDILHA